MAKKKHSSAHDALGRAVKWSRARHGWSQEELGFHAGLHRNYIGAVERGEINPTFAVMRRLARGLEMPLSELVAAGETVEQERRSPRLMRLRRSDLYSKLASR